MSVYEFRFGGTLYSDIWECGLHLENTNPLGADLTNRALQDLATDASTYITSGFFSQAVTLTWVKLNEIDPKTRKYISQTDSNTLQLATPVTGTSTSAVAPQLSLCVSLKTAAQRGVAAHGRFYPPPQSMLIDMSTGRVQSQSIGRAMDAAKTFIQNVNNWPGIDLPASPHVVVLGHTGATRAVTGLRIGDVMDTQRRRRNALREGYTVADL